MPRDCLAAVGVAETGLSGVNFNEKPGSFFTSDGRLLSTGQGSSCLRRPRLVALEARLAVAASFGVLPVNSEGSTAPSERLRGATSRETARSADLHTSSLSLLDAGFGVADIASAGPLLLRRVCDRHVGETP